MFCRFAKNNNARSFILLSCCRQKYKSETNKNHFANNIELKKKRTENILKYSFSFPTTMLLKTNQYILQINIFIVLLVILFL